MSDLSQSPKPSDSVAKTEHGADTSDSESFSRFGSDGDPSQQAEFRKSEPRPFKPRQFLFGLALSTGGMGLMLFVAAGALHDAGAGGAVSLPATGLCMILGLMLLGGGFGQMAISSPSFDDSEFQRMLNGDVEESGSEDGIEDGSEDNGPSGVSDLDESVKDDHQHDVTVDVSDGHQQIEAIDSQISDTGKRSQSEPRDSFVATVMSDVVASSG
ncbi:MAG: hypothetical protein ABJZ55_10545 [Fuerstiella sp.]